jgi:DNA mismatch endonuclease Vsr
LSKLSPEFLSPEFLAWGRAVAGPLSMRAEKPADNASFRPHPAAEVIDSITKERRSENMRRIRSKNTKPELVVRTVLARLGYRYRLHVQELPGAPNIVLT